MATKKSPARGTASRPAKTTTAISKPRAAAKKSIKVSAKPAAAQPSPAQASPDVESNVVTLSPVDAAPVTAEKPAEPAPAAKEAAVEEVMTKAETVVEAPAPIDEPEPFEELIPLKDHAKQMAATSKSESVVDETAAEEIAVAETVTEETAAPEKAADDTEVEMTFSPNAFSGASLFANFPQLPNMPEFPAFGAVDMKAFVASSTAMVEGMQSIGQELMDFSRKTAERNVEATKAVFGASSVQEAIEMQSRHTTGSLNDLMAESTKLSGMAMDVASKATSSFTRS